jgi:hypothetical protein
MQMSSPFLRRMREICKSVQGQLQPSEHTYVSKVLEATEIGKTKLLCFTFLVPGILKHCGNSYCDERKVHAIASGSACIRPSPLGSGLTQNLPIRLLNKVTGAPSFAFFAKGGKIIPLRYASVGMTKGRVALPFRSDAADDEQQVPPLRYAPGTDKRTIRRSFSSPWVERRPRTPPFAVEMRRKCYKKMEADSSLSCANAIEWRPGTSRIAE